MHGGACTQHQLYRGREEAFPRDSNRITSTLATCCTRSTCKSICVLEKTCKTDEGQGLDQTIALNTKVLDLHVTQLHDHLIPKIHEALRVHVVERTAACPILMTLLSPYKEFTDALWSLVDLFQYDVSYAASQLLAALDLACVPFAKLHLRNIIGDNHITNDLWNKICLLKKGPKAWNIILEALEKLPQLRVLDIVCLQPPNLTTTSPSEPQSLKRTLRRCGLSQDLTALRTNITRHLNMKQVLALHEKSSVLNQ